MKPEEQPRPVDATEPGSDEPSSADPETQPSDEPQDEIIEAAHESACPHCGGERIPHDGSNPHKPAGSLHCDRCGCCFQPDGVTVREGHSTCQPQLEATTLV
jgi:hypothetical protein